MRKRYFLIGNDGIFYMIKKQDQQGPVITPGELVNLKFCSVKESVDAEYPFCFEINSVHHKKPLIFQTHSEIELKEWISALKNVMENLLSNNSASFAMNMYNSYGSNAQEDETRHGKIKEIIKKNFCADCGEAEPSWISLNLAVLVCIDCSGVHRKLGIFIVIFVFWKSSCLIIGPIISKIRSLKLDSLNEHIINLFYNYGTDKVNQIWESQVTGYINLKPKPGSSSFEKEKWIRMKYIDRIFLKNPGI